MSFKENNYEQMSIYDRFNNQAERVKKLVMNSWAKPFADYVFPAINEKRFSVLYSENDASRPNAPINVIISALLLKEYQGLTDEELIYSINCDIRYQYALYTTSCEVQPISLRTISRFREKIAEYEMKSGINLLAEELTELNEVYMQHMKLTSNIKRMDSLMIASHCKRMSRLEIIYTVNYNAVRLLNRLGNEDLIPGNLAHYLNEDDRNDVIYYCENDAVQSRLEKAVSETEQLKEIMSDDNFYEFDEYKMIIRVLSEQSKKDENGKTILKENKEIKSDSLQNPSDPDATYRKKAGKDYKGYVGNTVETLGEDGASLITSIGYEVNTHSDSDFCKEYLETHTHTEETEIMIADGAYGGYENEMLAAVKNVELVTTALTGKDPNKIYSEFELSDDGKEVIKCPAGNAPVKSRYHEKNDVCRAVFSKECCKNCPHFNECHPTEQKKSFVIHISKKKVARAKHLKKFSEEKYKKYGRMRNGVEGVMSVLRRKYHIDDIPVFGLVRSRTFFICKIMAYNFTKFLKHRITKGVVCPDGKNGDRNECFFFTFMRFYLAAFTDCSYLAAA